MCNTSAGWGDSVAWKESAQLFKVKSCTGMPGIETVDYLANEARK